MALSRVSVALMGIASTKGMCEEYFEPSELDLVHLKEEVFGKTLVLSYSFEEEGKLTQGKYEATVASWKQLVATFADPHLCTIELDKEVWDLLYGGGKWSWTKTDWPYAYEEYDQDWYENVQDDPSEHPHERGQHFVQYKWYACSGSILCCCRCGHEDHTGDYDWEAEPCEDVGQEPVPWKDNSYDDNDIPF